VRDIFTVNWTLFPSFDKNIEFAIECGYSVLCDACCAWKRREYKLATATKHSDGEISMSVPATQCSFD
jgi:hypothetical protein